MRDGACAWTRDAGSFPPSSRCPSAPMSLQDPVIHGTTVQSAAERELAELLVESLNLEEVDAAGIDPEAPLFGDGLGLDSIDALELALAVSKKYGFQLRSDNDANRRIFASLRALSAHVELNRAAA